MIIEALQFKEALSNFASGVAVVTTMNEENEPTGVTITSFTSLSLNPPLVLFCLNKSSASVMQFKQAEFFIVNILAENQRNIANQFAYVHGADRWNNVEITAGQDSKAPVIKDCIAYIECQRVCEYTGGDHIIFTGRVKNYVPILPQKKPLIRFKGQYDTLSGKIDVE